KASRATSQTAARKAPRTFSDSLKPIPPHRALVPYLPPPPPPPSYSQHTIAAGTHRSDAPVVRWLDGYEGTIPLGSVTIMTGKSGSGKTALMCSWISDLTRRGKRVVIYHSAEDTHAMWERRIELMGGDLRFVRFVESRSKVWDVLKDQNLPEVVVIDPLQQF